MILLITSKEDVTADLVVDRLNQGHDAYYRFNTEELCNTVNLVFRPQHDELTLFDVPKSMSINLRNIKSVYFRRPKLPTPPPDLSLAEQQFVLNEQANTLEAMYRYLDGKFWISNVNAIRQAENKLYQQLIAQDFGFKIPQSIVTNDYNEAVTFLRQYGECIIKPVRTGFVCDATEPKVIFSSLITENDTSVFERIKECPTYLQEHIKKTVDIRVTVVGNMVFSAKILSQEYEETKVDWRKGENTKLVYKSIDLGPELNAACIKLTERLGLNFGAIDFILDAKGEFIFLEINPNGQWGWIQYRLDYDIAGAIANLLRNDKN